MGILNWEKPPKARSTEEHNASYQSDTQIAGTYVPNMSKEWKETWKAKAIVERTADPRVEIRKTTQAYPGQQSAEMLIVVRYTKNQGLHVVMSSNGKMYLEATQWWQLSRQAVDEAYNWLVQHGHQSPLTMEEVR